MKGCRSAGPDFEIPAHQGDFLLRHQPVLPHEISPLIRNHVVLEAEKPKFGQTGSWESFFLDPKTVKVTLDDNWVLDDSKFVLHF